MTDHAPEIQVSPNMLATWRCSSGAPRLSEAELTGLLRALPQWTLADGAITRTFRFDGFDQTMAFVNALAWIARRENHHPDVSVHFRHCVVSFTTHDAGGVTRNDVTCAAKSELLLA